MVDTRRQIKLYLWKNAIQKRRHPIASLCELLCPLAVIGVMALVYRSANVQHFDSKVYGPWLETGSSDDGMSPDQVWDNGFRGVYSIAPGDPSAYYGGTFDFFLLANSLTRCREKVAVVGADADVNAFLARMDETYPGLNITQLENLANKTESDVPPFSAVVKRFPSDDAVDAYVQDASRESYK